MNHLSRRKFLGTGAAAAVGSASSVWAAEVPVLDTVTIASQFPPGGNSDRICRSLAEAMRGKYARNAVVDNRTGAGGQIAVSSMKSKAKDGSQLLVAAGSTLTIYPHTYKNLAYDPRHDLIAVSLACRFDVALAVGPAVPESVKTLADFLQWAKGNPVRANFGTGGAGTSGHLLGAAVAKEAGVDLSHVAYRGSVPAIQDLMGAQISAVLAPLGEFLAYEKAGRIRLIAVAADARNPFTPNTLTFGEQGFAKFRAPDWYGVFLPAGADASTIRRANQAVADALGAPGIRTALADIGVEPAASTPEQLTQLLVEDLAYWQGVVKVVGFTAES